MAIVYVDSSASVKLLVDEEDYGTRREASINDVAIAASDRRIFGPRPPGDRMDLALS